MNAEDSCVSARKGWWRSRIALLAAGALCAVVSMRPAAAQSAEFYRRTLTVTAAEVTTLDVGLPRGELQVFYSHEGQVSVTASMKNGAGSPTAESLTPKIALDQDGNRIRLRVDAGSSNDSAGILCRLDVPYRTTVKAVVAEGRLAIGGVSGPVQAETGRGNIDLSYISREVTARANKGSVTLQVIGARASVTSGGGNISVTRAAAGIVAETADGDITLMVVGPSVAIVKAGAGRINIGGARGSLMASTDAGELHVKAIPHDDWRLASKSGAVDVELPPSVKLNLDAESAAGPLAVERDDISHSSDGHILQQLNGGGPRVEVRSERGRITIR